MTSQSDFTAEKLFADKPIELQLYYHIQKFIESLGPVTISVTRTQVAFANKKKFAWVWLPMEWDKRRPPNSIILSFSLKKHITNPQIVQAVEPRTGRWMHHVVITNTSDLNESVKEWLQEAYKTVS